MKAQIACVALLFMAGCIFGEPGWQSSDAGTSSTDQSSAADMSTTPDASTEADANPDPPPVDMGPLATDMPTTATPDAGPASVIRSVRLEPDAPFVAEPFDVLVDADGCSPVVGFDPPAAHRLDPNGRFIAFAQGTVVVVCGQDETVKRSVPVAPQAPGINAEPDVWLTTTFGVERPMMPNPFRWNSFGSLQPTYFEARDSMPPPPPALEGRFPRLRFEGAQILSANWPDGSYSGPFGGEDFTLFVAGSVNPTGSNETLLSRCHLGNNQFNIRQDRTPPYLEVIANGATPRTETFDIDESQAAGEHVYALRVESGSTTSRVETFVDGVSTGSTSGNRVSLDFDQIGGRCGTGGQNLNGELLEVIIYPTPLTSAEVQAVSEYLGTKLSL